MFLLDTNVISETRKPRPHGAVKAWFQSTPGEQIAIPAVVFGELQAGIEDLRPRDPDRALALTEWLELLASTSRVIPMGVPEFREWARLMNGKPAQLFTDAMIAATARVHGLTVATRNVADFRPFQVPILNPFETPNR